MRSVRSAGIYARISNDPGGEGLGVARQVTECQRLAAQRGWPVLDVFVDNDVSAFGHQRRPEYERLLDAIRNGFVDAVVVYHLDRLTRRPRELETFVDICDRAGITSLGTVAGDVNIGTSDGLLVARITAAVAANESASKSRRLRSKWRQVAESGQPLGGAARAYGYEPDGLTIREVEADVIRRCAAEVISGVSIRRLAMSLNDLGVPAAKGGVWRSTSLRNVLMNPRTAGLRAHCGQIVATGTWTAILTCDVQAEVIASIQARSLRGRRPSQRYLLSGLLRCGRCGETLYASTHRDFRRYACGPEPEHHGCGRVSVVAAPLEALITESVLSRWQSSADADGQGGETVTVELADLQQHITAEEERRTELGERLAREEITSREWIILRRPIEAQLRDAHRRTASLTTSPAGLVADGRIRELRERWPALSLHEQTTVIRSFLDSIVIRPATRSARTLDPKRIEVVWR
jgi:DNA invertase Pin-like site-specific DNA recombinase